MLRPHLFVLTFAFAGCLGEQHTFSLDVGYPDGRQESLALSGKTGLADTTGGGFSASWPSIADWGPRLAPNGVLVNLNPVQPGTQMVSGSLFLGKEVEFDFRRAYALNGTVELERVSWTGNGSFPILLTGTLTGTSSAGHTVKGRFTISTDNCNDNTGTDELVCGRPLQNVRTNRGPQKWKVGRWAVNPACPKELVEKLSGGDVVTIDTAAFKGAGSQALQCVVTYDPRNEQLCGWSEEANYGGCRWSTFAWAYPSSDSAPTYQVFAGTVGTGCEPQTCGMQAFDLTWVD